MYNRNQISTVMALICVLFLFGCSKQHNLPNADELVQDCYKEMLKQASDKIIKSGYIEVTPIIRYRVANYDYYQSKDHKSIICVKSTKTHNDDTVVNLQNKSTFDSDVSPTIFYFNTQQEEPFVKGMSLCQFMAILGYYQGHASPASLGSAKKTTDENYTIVIAPTKFTYTYKNKTKIIKTWFEDKKIVRIDYLDVASPEK